jgi:hypothetical protein
VKKITPDEIDAIEMAVAVIAVSMAVLAVAATLRAIMWLFNMPLI